MGIEARCVICDHEVESCKGLQGCPKCGSVSPPLSPKEDQTFKMNRWELRILCTWAERWTMAVKQEHEQAKMGKLLRAIGERLKKQMPEGSTLFLSDEIGDLKREFPGTQTDLPTI